MRHASHSRLFVLLALAACGPAEPLEQRVERQLLLGQKAALERELARADDAGHRPGAMVVIPASLVQRLVAAALPFRTEVAGRFLVSAERATVDFSGGLALVRLGGHVAWADREDVSASIDLIGALRVLDIEEADATLRARVEILGFATRDVRIGALSPPAEQLLDELARRPTDELNALLREIEIPVRLAGVIPLPAVEDDDITIPATALPLRVALHDVRVARGRLWVHIDVTPPPPAAS